MGDHKGAADYMDNLLSNLYETDTGEFMNSPMNHWE